MVRAPAPEEPPMSQRKYRIAVIPGDGIGKETTPEGLRVRLDWLWRDPLPTLDEALADLST